jgi:hypothetical protein
LVLSSFMPIVQIYILYINGALISVFTNSDDKIYCLINLVASIFMLGLFYFSNITSAKVVSILGFLLFFIPLILYATDKLIDANQYYWIQFLVADLIAGIIVVAL